MDSQTNGGFFSGQVTVGKDDWHYHLYKWWESHSVRGGLRRGYRENFCHYVRVLVFLVPLTWFFVVPIYKGIRPWMAVVFPTLFGGIAYCFWRWPSTSWHVLVNAVKFTATLILVGACVIGFILAFLTDEGELRPWVNQTCNFIWGCIKPLGSWFFTWGWKVFFPWTVTVAISLGYGAWLLGWENIQSGLTWLGMLLIWLLLIAALGAIAVAVVYNLIYKPLHRREEDRQLRKVGLPRSERDHGTSTPKLVGHFMMAKKRKICPFIDLPDSGPTYSFQGGEED